jgi:hypothetical protein
MSPLFNLFLFPSELSLFLPEIHMTGPFLLGIPLQGVSSTKVKQAGASRTNFKSIQIFYKLHDKLYRLSDRHFSADRGVSRGQRGRSPTVINLSFLDRSRYFFFQVAPNLSSQVLSGPRSRPTATQKI